MSQLSSSGGSGGTKGPKLLKESELKLLGDESLESLESVLCSLAEDGVESLTKELRLLGSVCDDSLLSLVLLREEWSVDSELADDLVDSLDPLEILLSERSVDSLDSLDPELNDDGLSSLELVSSVPDEKKASSVLLELLEVDSSISYIGVRKVLLGTNKCICRGLNGNRFTASPRMILANDKGGPQRQTNIERKKNGAIIRSLICNRSNPCACTAMLGIIEKRQVA